MSETDDDDTDDETATESSSVAKTLSSPSSSSRLSTLHRRRPWRARIRYTHILDAHTQDSLSPIDSLTPLKHKHKPRRLHTSTILNTVWTHQEKNRFFTALARCGKGNLAEVARRVGSKSLVEVTAYVGVLDEEMTLRKRSLLGPRRVFDYGVIPAAVEVDEQWIAFEERMARGLGKKSDEEVDMEEAEDDEDMIINVEKANELARWYQNALAKQTIRTKTLDPTNIPSVLSPDTIHTFNTLINQLTHRLIRTVLFLTQSQHRSDPRPPTVTVSIARTAIDILGLPRHFGNHFSTLPRRLNITVTNAKRNGGKIIDLETLEQTLPSGKKVDRRRCNTPIPWPDEWDRRSGFDWPVESDVVRQSSTSRLDDSDEDEDEWYEMSIPEGLEQEPDPDIPGIPDDVIRESRSPSPLPAHEVDMEEAENFLLDTETTYLEALDTQSSLLELEKLHNHIKHGIFVSQRKHKAALAALSPEMTEDSRRKWEADVRQFCRLHGYEWAEYEDEIVDVEGREWDRVEEWEGMQKRRGGEELGRLKRERSEEWEDEGRKRRIVRGGSLD